MAKNILLTLEYDGSEFHGWQVQPNTRTVQRELEAILRLMYDDDELRVTGSGRTDSGVHALGMGATFMATKDIPMEGLVRGLNSQLPKDIVILTAREVPATFCARHSAQGKRYRYKIWNTLRRPAIERKRTWHISDPLDIFAMQKAASYLIGRHDFSSFRGAGCASKHPHRDLHEISIFQEGSMIVVEVNGSAFLRHMVRNIVGCLVDVGKGVRPPEWMDEVLKSKNRSKASLTAPAQGLYMVFVRYTLPPLDLDSMSL